MKSIYVAACLVACACIGVAAGQDVLAATINLQQQMLQTVAPGAKASGVAAGVTTDGGTTVQKVVYHGNRKLLARMLSGLKQYCYYCRGGYGGGAAAASSAAAAGGGGWGGNGAASAASSAAAAGGGGASSAAAAAAAASGGGYGYNGFYGRKMAQWWPSYGGGSAAAASSAAAAGGGVAAASSAAAASNGGYGGGFYGNRWNNHFGRKLMGTRCYSFWPWSNCGPNAGAAAGVGPRGAVAFAGASAGRKK